MTAQQLSHSFFRMVPSFDDIVRKDSLPYGVNSLLFAALFAFLFSCSSASSYDKVKPGVKFKISCTDGKATRHHYAPETGEITERGPVLLAKDMTCGKAEDLDEKEMLKLQRDGEWFGYYKGTTNVLWKGLFKKNKREGVLVYFDTKGTKSKIITYVGGEKEGVEEGYFGSGGIRYKGQNSENMKTGPWEEKASEKSDCVSKGSYVKDEKSGPWQECVKDEKEDKYYVNFRGSYSHGLKDGPVEVFHPNGALLGKGSYRADLVCKDNPPPEGVDACGKRTGPWTLYHPSAKLAAEGEYDGATGKRRGTWTEYYVSGEKMAMGPRNHTREGNWTFFLKSGEIMGQFGFKGNDAMISYCIIYEKGVKKEEGPCMGALIKYEAEKDALKLAGKMMQSDLWKGYHPSGAKAYEGTYVTGQKTGIWKFYNEGGALIAQGEFRMNKKVGPWKEMKDGRMVQIEYDDFGRPKK